MNMRSAKLAPAFLASLLLVASSASADWPAGGKLVSIVDDSFNGLKSVRVMDLPNGEMYVLSVGRGGNANGYTLQRIGPGGDLAPGWTTNGYSFSQYVYSSTLMGFTVDDSGCVWRAQFGLDGSTTKPQSQLVRPDGLLLPSSPSAWNASTVGGSLGQGMAVAPAPGGSFVAFGAKLQRMTRAGAIASGWPATGVPGVNSHCPALQADGAGGAVVFGASAIGSPPTAQRVDATGARHAGWPVAGLLLAAGPEDGLADFETPNFLLPSGPGWLIAGWVTPYPSSSPKHLQLQRFSLDGALDPAWPANGVTAIAPDTITGVTLIADGLGGVHALWYAHGRPLGTHLRADGTFQPGLAAAGVDLAALDPQFAVPGYAFGRLPYVVADAVANGGLLFAYDNFLHFFTASYHVRWLNADYTPNAGEPAAGRVVVPALRGRSVRAVHSDGIGGAYLAWDASPNDDQVPSDPSQLWMTRLLASSLVGVPAQPHGGSFALSAPRPNPSREAVAMELSLPDDTPARVELLDVAGRIQRSQSVQGAGAHAVAFRDLGTLAPGLYFARASYARGEATTRVVITH
jgi:hypothetical protein